jgi:hypothetical protein
MCNGFPRGRAKTGLDGMFSFTMRANHLASP